MVSLVRPLGLKWISFIKNSLLDVPPCILKEPNTTMRSLGKTKTDIAPTAEEKETSRSTTKIPHISSNGKGGYRYNAFISYSHKADSRFVPVLHSAIEQLGKPWYRRRALNVFRDDTDLAVNPELWPTIERALNESEYFLLLACPESAVSEGVRREVNHWINILKRDSRKVLIAVTGGKLVWNEHEQDFDWSETTPLPVEFKGYFLGHPEPLWADFCDCKSEDRLRADDATFRRAAVKVAAGLHRVAPRDLESADLREHKIRIRIFSALVVSLSVLLVMAVLLFLDARRQRQEAERRARVAQSRALAVQAMDRSDKGLDASLLLSVESHRLADTMESRKALLNNLLDSPHIYRFLDGVTGVKSLTFRPSPPALVAASGNSILIWDTDASQPTRRLTEAGEIFEGVGFMESGGLLAAATESGKVILWDFEKDIPIATLSLERPVQVRSATTHPNSRFLVVSVDSGIVIWDLQKRTVHSVVLLGEDDAVLGLALSPTEDVVAVSSRLSGIRLWDIGRKKNRSTRFEGHSGLVEGLAFSPDGKVLASGGEDGSVRLWDAATGSPGQNWLRQGFVSHIQFSRDGRFLAWGSLQGGIKVFDLKEQRLLRTSRITVENGVGALAFSPDGKMLVVGSQTSGHVIELDPIHENTIATVQPAHHEWITGIVFSPDGNLVASVSRDGELILWDARQRTIRNRPPKVGEQIGNCIKFSPDSTTLITCSTGGNAVVWRVDGGSATAGGVIAMTSGRIKSVAFRPDGRLLAAGGTSGKVLLWDGASPERSPPTQLAEIGCQITVLEFDPKGNIIAVGCTDGKIHLIDSQAGKQTGEFTGPVNPISNLRFSPDGNVLYSASAEGIIAWNLRSHAMIGTPLHLQGSGASSMAISPYGMIASSSGLGEIALWDTERRLLLGNLPSHGDSIFSFGFAPDGRVLAAGSGYQIPEDNAVMFWDLDPELWVQRACAIAGRNLTPEEWLRYANEAVREESCPNNGPHIEKPAGRAHP